MGEIPECIDGLPNICGSEQRIEEVIRARGTDRVFLPPTGTGFGNVDSAFAIALHMHQPLIPAGVSDLRTAPIISNLQWMMDNPGIGDNYNAPVFLGCYKRMGEFVPRLLDEGLAPRVMLEYSGTLLHGLRQMGAHDVLDALAGITAGARNRQAVEWLGCPWGHAVAPSTQFRTIGCTCGPGNTISLPCSAWMLSAGSAASPPRRWPCPTTRMSPTSS